MAAVEGFSESMNRKELCTYLKKLGMDGNDAQKIQDKGYNGRTILLLNEEYNRENRQQLYRELLNSSCLVLDSLLAGYHQSYKKSTSQPEGESGFYTSLKLGYGVDISNPAPVRNSDVKTRRILEDLSNIDEVLSSNKRESYSEKISSMNDHISSIRFNVSDVIEQAVNLGAEAEYSRDTSREMIAKGERHITRSLMFNSKCVNRDNNFEAKICKWIIEHVPEIASLPENSDEGKVEMFLRSHLANNEILDTVHNFFKKEQITHYVHGIELGAAKYSVSIKVKSKKTLGGSVKVGMKNVADAEAGLKSSQSSMEDKSEMKMIGDIDNVERGKGEAVLRYKFLPVHTLICESHREIKKVVQIALLYYLKSESGPFKISCGQDFKTFLVVKPNSTLRGTESKKDGSIFYIKKSICPEEFTVVYHGDKISDTHTFKCLKTHARSRITGQDEGPLKLSQRKASKFVLRRPLETQGNVPISTWEYKVSYVKLAPRRAQRQSYVGFDHNLNKTICVSKLDEEDKPEISLQFKLMRVNICDLKLDRSMSITKFFQIFNRGELGEAFGHKDLRIVCDSGELNSDSDNDNDNDNDDDDDDDDNDDDDDDDNESGGYDFEYEFDQVPEI